MYFRSNIPLRNLRKLGSESALALVLTTASLLGSPSVVVAQNGSTMIRAEKLYRMDGSEPGPGCVLVTNGKIQLVEAEIRVDDSIATVDVPVLMPGLIDAYANVDFVGGGADRALEVAPDFDVTVGLDLASKYFRRMAEEGITTLHVLPDTESVISGNSALLNSSSASGEATIANEAFAPVIAMCTDPTRLNRSRSRPDSIFVRQPTNRMGVMWILRQQMQSFVNADDTDTGSLVHQAVADNGRIFSVSRSEVDILSVLTLASDFGFQPVIVDANEAYRVADQLADSQTPVIVRELPVRADARSLRGSEGTELRWNHLGKLHEEGVRFAIAGGNLLEKARFAHRFGLDSTQALHSITTVPAQLLQLDSDQGKIQPGMNANFVALSKEPLDFTSTVLATWIAGELVSSDGSIE